MIHLVLGGARSGKSRFAETVANHSKSVIYVATATAGDEEMRQRIEMHQQSRPQDWRLIEEPFNLSSVVKRYSNSETTLLIECMTLWVSNWLCTNDVEGWQQEKKAFIQALKNAQCDLVIVSNEVGSGVVPLGELSREFVDQSGWLNQSLSSLSDKVTLVVAGCGLDLKSGQLRDDGHGGVI